MRHGWWMMVAVLAAPASAQGAAEVGACVVDQASLSGAIATCDITNSSQTPIAAVRYAFRIVEDGRTVPWGEGGYDEMFHLIVEVPGGIEPGETVPVQLLVERLPSRADPTRARYEIELLEVGDVNGNPIP